MVNCRGNNVVMWAGPNNFSAHHLREQTTHQQPRLARDRKRALAQETPRVGASPDSPLASPGRTCSARCPLLPVSRVSFQVLPEAPSPKGAPQHSSGVSGSTSHHSATWRPRSHHAIGSAIMVQWRRFFGSISVFKEYSEEESNYTCTPPPLSPPSPRLSADRRLPPTRPPPLRLHSHPRLLHPHLLHPAHHLLHRRVHRPL